MFYKNLSQQQENEDEVVKYLRSDCTFREATAFQEKSLQPKMK